MPQGTQACDGRHYPLWSKVLIFNGNLETKYLLLTVRIPDTSKDFGNTNILFHSPSQHWILIITCIKVNPNKGNACGHISQCAQKKNTSIDIHMVWVKKDNKLWSFVLHSFHQLTITFSLSLSFPLSRPNNFLSTTWSPYPTIWSSPYSFVAEGLILCFIRWRVGFPDNAK
jgi:hypothetical protein